MLYIMRHGRTDWNDLKKLQGQTDIPLNDAGRKMAREAGEKYADVHFDLCYCSPLSRALETAQLVLEGRNVPILQDDRLKEMGFGSYEGIQNSFQLPDCNVNNLFWDPAHYVADGGAESMDALYERTGAFLEEMVFPRFQAAKEHGEPEPDILIVGHGSMNLSIINRIKNIPRSEYWSTGIENCRLIRLI